MAVLPIWQSWICDIPPFVHQQRHVLFQFYRLVQVFFCVFRMRGSCRFQNYILPYSVLNSINKISIRKIWVGPSLQLARSCLIFDCRNFAYWLINSGFCRKQKRLKLYFLVERTLNWFSTRTGKMSADYSNVKLGKLKLKGQKSKSKLVIRLFFTLNLYFMTVTGFIT